MKSNKIHVQKIIYLPLKHLNMLPSKRGLKTVVLF